jgi:hypothetical protein
MGFSSHQQMQAGPSGRVVGCSHFSRWHYGDRSAPRRRHIRRRSSEAGQREHVIRQGIAVGSWSGFLFLCLSAYLAPPRQVVGRAPRDEIGRHPSCPGGPVAGAPACVPKHGPLYMTCAPRGPAPPVWRWARRMPGLERLISWLPALASAGGLAHQAPWTPLGRSQVNRIQGWWAGTPGARLSYTPIERKWGPGRRRSTTSQPRKGDVTGCHSASWRLSPVVSGGYHHPTGWWGHPEHRQLPREVPGTRDPTTARYIRCIRGMREARSRSPPSHHWTPAPRAAAPWPRLARRAVLRAGPRAPGLASRKLIYSDPDLACQRGVGELIRASRLHDGAAA